jgi:hypothetical protein
MNWWGFILTMLVMSSILLAVALAIYGRGSDEKEVPCYDNHNNVIKGVTCENKMVLSESAKLWGIMFTVFVWFVMLFINIRAWREQC